MFDLLTNQVSKFIIKFLYLTPQLKKITNL
jgi:hypothetical protein